MCDNVSFERRFIWLGYTWIEGAIPSNRFAVFAPSGMVPGGVFVLRKIFTALAGNQRVRSRVSPL